MSIFTILIIIFGFSFLIIAHELGHFLAAKWSGMKVEEFGIGFPPNIFSWKPKKSETAYSINWIPFGGFVRIKGEDEILDSGQKPDSDSFKAKPIWKRMFVTVAGVVMNIFVAVIILSFVAALGIPSGIDDSNENAINPQVQIVSVGEGTPAESAGLQAGDIIEKINFGGDAKNVSKVQEIIDIANNFKEKEIIFTINREGSQQEIALTPRADHPEEEGPIGIGLARIGLVRVAWYKAPVESVKLVWDIAKTMLSFLGDMLARIFTKGQVPQDIVGPVGIVALSGKIVKMGWVYVGWLFALISINLFLINLLPIPALDGGRLLFLAIEKVKGSPISEKLEQKLHFYGFVFLIALMILITIRDVSRLF
ncbi:MAG: site-2 protease family protein [bacterium]